MIGFLVALALIADETLMSLRGSANNPFFRTLPWVLSRSANGAFLLPAAFFVILILRERRKSLWRWIMILMISGILVGTVGTVLRSVIGRTRPNTSVLQGWYGPRSQGKWLVGRYAYSSFPSGHTSLAAGFGLMLF
ncbi:MAG: phosphatase PAP2 family protein [Pedosphaera sp.]|nr:phosphatase PAP2 family protein [Pedosphaera sp.]